MASWFTQNISEDRKVLHVAPAPFWTLMILDDSRIPAAFSHFHAVQKARRSNLPFGDISG